MLMKMDLFAVINFMIKNFGLQLNYRFEEVFLNVKAARKFHMILHQIIRKNLMSVVALGTALYW